MQHVVVIWMKMFSCLFWGFFCLWGGGGLSFFKENGWKRCWTFSFFQKRWVQRKAFALFFLVVVKYINVYVFSYTLMQIRTFQKIHKYSNENTKYLYRCMGSAWIFIQQIISVSRVLFLILIYENQTFFRLIKKIIFES